MKLRLPRRKAPAYNVTIRSRSGRVLSPLSASPVTGGMVYGRKARSEVLSRARSDRDLEVVSVRRRSLADARTARAAARQYRRSHPRVPVSREWEHGPDVYRSAPASTVRERADRVLGAGRSARAAEAWRQANVNPWAERSRGRSR